MPSILYEDDFIDFTIIDLLKQYWHITYIYKNNPDLIFFYFFLTKLQEMVSELLREEVVKIFTTTEIYVEENRTTGQ